MSLGIETALPQLCLRTVLAVPLPSAAVRTSPPASCPTCRAVLMHRPSEPRLLTPGQGCFSSRTPLQPTSVMRSEQTRIPRVGFKSHVSRASSQPHGGPALEPPVPQFPLLKRGHWWCRLGLLPVSQ